MTRRPSPLSRSITIVNTLWVPAAVLFFIEHVGISKSLGFPFNWYRFIDPGISLFAKTIFLAWIWGLIIESVTHESLTPRRNSFNTTLKKNWPVILATLLIPQAVHAILFMITGKDMISLPLLQAFFHVFTTYWAAGELFKNKYSALVTRKIKESPSWSTAVYGAFFLLISIMLSQINLAIANTPFIAPLGQLLTIQVGLLVFTVFTTLTAGAYPEIQDRFNAKKTLILVSPAAGSIRAETFAPVFLRRYPFSFAILKALTPADYRIVEYNRVTWREHFYQDNALVAITCFTTNSATAYHIAQEFRRKGATVIMGGPHVTFFPHEALEFCNSVVIGPAEGVWESVIQDYENGSLQRIYQGHCPADKARKVYDSLLTQQTEVISETLMISSACKFNCHFCCATALTGDIAVKKTVAETIALIEKIPDKKAPLVFLDNNIYTDPAYAKELFQALIPFKRRWGSNASINIAQDDEAIRLLKASRCFQLLIGYEIDGESTIQENGGKFTLAKDYITLTKKLQQAGILIQAQFIFGFPQDSWASLKRLWGFCMKLSPAYTVVSFLTPLPGSRYFEESVREERILNLNWRCYDLMRQVAETPHIKSSWVLQNCFSLISYLIFFSTSLAGRLLVAAVIIMEVIYYHVPN